MKADILIFGAHPDDIEIGTSGIIAKYIHLNKSIILVDLTAGEMGSNGTREIRLEESQDAARVLGVSKRLNLEIKDKEINLSKENIRKVVEVIREYKPRVVLYPYKEDYHPDHEACSILVREAIHTSGLIKYNTGQNPFRPEKVYNYYINDIIEPNIYEDITEFYDVKIAALAAHKSQFLSTINSVETYLNTSFIENVETRDKYWGTKCNCKYAELLYFNGLIKGSIV